MRKFLDIWYKTYDYLQVCHFATARTNVPYRYVSLSVIALLAPVIVLVLWTPGYINELVEFYSYLPKGFRGRYANSEAA